MNEMPVHAKIKDDIKAQIGIGVYKKNSPLPSENELSIKYGVSRATVQKALSALSAENILYSVPGKGNFVKEESFDNYRFKYDELLGFSIKLLGVDIILPIPDVIYNLQIPPKKRVVCVRRIALQKETPVAYDVKYIPYFSGIPIIESEINYSVFPDLVVNLASAYDLKREIYIRGAYADEVVGAALKMPVAAPLVEVEQKLYDENDVAIGWGKVFYKTEYFAVSAKKE